MSQDTMTIRGLQKAQEWNLRAQAALTPKGALGRAVQFVTIGLHRLSVAYAHVDFGAMKASIRLEVNLSKMFGKVYIDPRAVNRSGKRPAEYGVYEHERGGSHAFFDRAMNDIDPLLSRAVDFILVEVS